MSDQNTKDNKRSDLTIVGGRPRAEQERAELPDGVQQVLVLAASDPKFREALLANREEALEQRGLELTPAERAVIMAAPADQLEAMVERLVPTDPERREFLMQAARAGGAIAAAALLAGTGCNDDDRPPMVKGIRPEPQPDPQPAGIRPDPVPPPDQSIRPTGIRPDPVPPVKPEKPPAASRGIRPDRPVPKTPPEEAPAEPDDDSKAKGGIRPDRPVEKPRILGIRPDRKTRGSRPDRPPKKKD